MMKWDHEMDLMETRNSVYISERRMRINAFDVTVRECIAC